MISAEKARKEKEKGFEDLYNYEIDYVNKNIKKACKRGENNTTVCLEDITKNKVIQTIRFFGYKVDEEDSDLGVFEISW